MKLYFDAMPVSAVSARSRILGEVVSIESAVPLETLSESVDVVRVPKAGDKVRLGALEETDLVWKAKRERRIHNCVGTRLARKTMADYWDKL